MSLLENLKNTHHRGAETLRKNKNFSREYVPREFFAFCLSLCLCISVVSAFRLLFFSALSLTLIACGEAKLPSPFKASDVTAQYAQADFHLYDATGKPRSLGDYRGKVVALFFGYTHCPDVCPTTLADMAQVMRQLEKDSDKLQVLFVTLDPERDTRELLAQYPPAFHPGFVGLSGDAAATAQTAKAFGVMYQRQEGKNGAYTLDHSAGTYLIAPDGRRVLLAPYQQKVEWLVQDIRLLLALDR